MDGMMGFILQKRSNGSYSECIYKLICLYFGLLLRKKSC